MDFSVLRDAPPPPDLQSGVGTFEPDPPGLREPGGSFMAALHQLHQRLRTDRSASPLEALALALRRANEDTKAAVLDDPVDYATYLIPSPRSTMLKVGPARVPPARRLPRFAPGGSVAGALRRLAARALPAFEEGAAAPYAPRGALSAVKPRGGQWLRGGELDAALQGFQPEGRRYTSEDLQYLQKNLAEMEAGGHSTPDLIDFQKGSIARVQRTLARNAWINNQLRRYVERDMATPQDPLDELFLRGEGHLSAEQLAGMGLDPRGGAGFPENGPPFAAAAWAHTPDALLRARAQHGRPRSAWGELADRAVYTGETAGDYVSRYNELLGRAGEDNPWVAKVPPGTPVYDLSGDEGLSRLGFDHVLDWLEQSGIPPERWKNVSVPQAVRGTGRWNAELAKRAEAARRASMEGLPRLKEYPSGYAWVELAAPRYSAETLPKGFRLEKWGYKGNPVWSIVDEKNITQTEAADSPEEALRRFSKGPHGEEILKRVLKEEGDAMGHCVGGYCDDVLSGRSRILSLRDAKTGRPEATVEVVPHRPIKELYDVLVAEGMPTRTAETWEEIAREPDEIGDQRIRKMYDELVEASPKFKIQQIKGRFNAAPRPEVLPYVQDLVRSMGPWSEVGDLQNTGLTKIKDKYVPLSDVKSLFNKHFKSGNPELALAYYNDMRRRDRAEMSDVDLGFLNAVDALAAEE